jgi:acetyltransferase-like isoleucine patch superfamily enzyme
MMMSATQSYIRNVRPIICGIITKILYRGRRVSIGKSFRCDSVPKIIVDKRCRVFIGDNVEFRRSIEIRAHGASEIKIDSNCRIDRGVRILGANQSRIVIHKGVRIGLYTVLNGGDSITIGKKSLVSGFVYLQTSMHEFQSKDTIIQNQGFLHKPIVLKEDCWLGTHVVVLPGVIIGTGSIVGSNAVVNKDVDSFHIVGGVPAKILKERD